MSIVEQLGRLLSALIFWSATTTSVSAADAPAARTMPVPLDRVKVDDAFWSPKLTIWRTVTVKDCFDKFEKEGALRNFDRVARGEPLWRVHECVFGVLALESEPVDPRL